MAETDILLIGIAVLLGLGAGVGLTFLLLRRRAHPKPIEPVAAFEILGVEDEPPIVAAEPADAFTFAPAKPTSRAPAPARSPYERPEPEAEPEPDPFGYERDAQRDELGRPPVPQMEDSSIPTEWARRQVGPVDPGRVKGVCSGCGTALSISRKRPLRIACPVCGRTRLLS